MHEEEKKTKDADRVEPDFKTDSFSLEEQEDIVRFVKQDIETDLQSMEDWIEQRAKDIEMYDGERPSRIENLNKEKWMSDRNMGLCAANCDAYQATLLATCYNIDTINYKATELNDVDHKEQLQKFTTWGLGKQEADFYPEVDDFIHNKVTQGISYFYVHWEKKQEWIDRRIPIYGNVGSKLMQKLGFKGYKIKTELKTFERGVIENIPDVSDLIFPAHGDTIQKKAHVIHKVHKTAKDLVDGGKKGEFVGITEDYKGTLKKYCYDHRSDLIRDEKGNQLGITDEDDLIENDLRLFPLDIFMWYGPYEKNGMYEQYRFMVEPQTNKFLAGKPLRKITRSGKRPYVGKPFIRRPGFLQGNSLPHLIEDPVNAFNNTWNQKSDFQYVENCPFGWYNPEEGHKEQERKIKPGSMFPSTDPQSVNIPNLTRSLAWAESDFRILFEVIERLTGAASYFQSRGNQSKTLGQDEMIESNSETRFGLWVDRIQSDICEAITMWLQMYQDWAPPDLGERVLGDNGKKLFRNLSIETLRGGYDATLTPDIIAGSKTHKREIAFWALETLSQTPWFDPMMNPKGSWGLVVRAAKAAGFEEIEKLMPPEPKAQFSALESVKDKWTQLRQGEMPEIEETDDVLEMYMGFMELAEEKKDDLDPEYRPMLEVFMFKLQKMMFDEMKKRAVEQEANRMAMGMIQDVEAGRQSKEDLVNA